MNASITPAYMVCHNNQISKPTRTFFTNASLLTARKAAMTMAESLFGCLIEFGDQEEMQVYLVEIASANDPAPVTIAQVLRRRPEQDIGEDCKDVLRELQMELAYYQAHSHPWGFGIFQLRVELDPKPLPWFNAMILFDALNYALVAIGAGRHQWQSFDVAYDARDEPAQLHPQA